MRTRRCAMSAYTVSQLAHNAGVSVHIVRDYRCAACYGRWPAPRAATACSTMRPCNGCASCAAFEAGIGPMPWRGCAVRSTQRTAHKPQRSLPCCASWSSEARRWPIWTRNWPPCQPSGRTRRHCRERPDKLPPETRQPVSGYLWGALAVLTCPAICRFSPPCWRDDRRCLPWRALGVAALALTGLFVLAVTRLLRLPGGS
uniref:MerE protein n=1 Tax=Klebsiella pneumoniae TaxID=573 RepID=A0A2P1BND2_KLEPN|nr:MerE protein [Klebsiella pneumoniae]